MIKLENVKVKKLRAFVAVAEGRDPLTELNVTYRTACRYVQEVEILFNYKLFEGMRVPRNLTKEGKILYGHVKPVVEEFNRLEQVLLERGSRW